MGMGNDGKVVISTEDLARAAKDFTAAAQVFEGAMTRFRARLASTANPRPWADDKMGQQFGHYYEDAESGTNKALDDVTTGLHNVAHAFDKMSQQYQATEEGNAR
jgi:hypothetical protein